MDKIRVGILGCGYIGAYHARAVLASEHAQLVAVVDENVEKRSDFVTKFQVPRWFSSFEDLLESKSVDAVVIALPNRFHGPYTLKALAQGVHVLVEKPMAFTAIEAAAMVEAADCNKLVLQVGHMWRFDPEVRYVADLISSGRLGKVFKTKGYGIHTNWGPAGWFTKKALAGGGSLVDMGIHAVDTTRFLLGDPLPVRVYAEVGTYVKYFDVDDTATVLITWDNGVHSLIESGWWQPHMDGPEAGGGVYGTQGYASLFPTRSSFFQNGTEQIEDPAFPPRIDHCGQAMYSLQMEEFLRAILEHGTPRPSAADGLVAMKILDAAYESARTGQAVQIR